MADTELLVQIASDLGELKGDVRALLQSQSAQAERANSHATRIGSLERSRSWVNGASAAVSAVVATAVTYFTAKL